MKYQKRFSKSRIHCESYALKMGVTRLFHVINQILTRLYVYELTSMCTLKMCDWYYGILLIPLHLLMDNAHIQLFITKMADHRDDCTPNKGNDI